MMQRSIATKTETVEAVYEGGSFRLVASAGLELAEGQKKQMRTDEEFVKDAILKWVSPQPHSVVSGGNNPPDYILSIGSASIALEVTTLSTVYVDKDGAVGNRRTVDECLFDINDELNNDYSSLVMNDKQVLLHYTGPIKNVRKYRGELKAIVQSRLGSSGFGPDWETFNIAGDRVRIKHIPCPNPNERKFVGIIDNKYSIVHIDSQARILLDEALDKKTRIMARLAFDGDRWLGLLNEYFLAEPETFQTVLNASSVQHCFARVFLVSPDGGLVELRI